MIEQPLEMNKATITFEFEGVQEPIKIEVYGTDRDIRILITRIEFWRKTEIAVAALLYEIERMNMAGDSTSWILYEEDPVMAAIKKWEARNEGATSQAEEREDG